MRYAALLALMMTFPAAAAQPMNLLAVLTDEVMDLYVYEPICGYRIFKEKLDIYLLGTPMFWGEPVSPGEIESVRTREVTLIGDNRDAKAKKCRSVTDNFGPTGHRARGIAQ